MATAPINADALTATFADVLAAHAVDMSDERKIDGEWVYGYCCDCGDFVPATGYNDHVARALVALTYLGEAS